MRTVYFGIVVLLLICVRVGAQAAQPAQTAGTDYLIPFPAHHVIGNVYFVGSKGLGIYLVTTPQGHILINAGLDESVPMIQQSVEKFGFRFSDIKILLISHAHFDHDAGAARIKKLTGAKYMVMDSDVPVVESGGGKDFAYAHTPGMLYPAAKVDRILHDGDTVTLGDTVLTAHLTPGHTEGVHHVDDEGERRRQKLRRGDCGQPQCESGIQTSEQCGVSADRRATTKKRSVCCGRCTATCFSARTGTITTWKRNMRA